MNFNRKYLSLWASVAFALFFFGASPAVAQISLGTAQSFAVLGGSTVTNTGSSTVTGNLGVSPGASVTGFPPGIVSGGTIHLNDADATQAQSDVTTAFNAIAGTACNVDLTGSDLGGLTLTPGVYCFSSSAQLTGTLTLNALGNPNALFIFKIGSSLTTASSSSVQVINPGSNCNVFWQVGSSATLGTSTSFVGNILALTSITLTTGANVSGRVLARNGAVTMDTNKVTVCAPAVTCPVITVNPATLPNGVLGTLYSQTVSAVGGTAPYTYTVSSGALPNGLTLDATTGVISGTPTLAGTFNFIITATDTNGCPGSRAYSIGIAGAPGCPVITVNPATLPPGVIGTPYSQTVSAVDGTAPYTFTVSSGTLPNGLTVNAMTGVISGTPTTAGQFNFTITATDANGCPGSRPYSIVIPGATGCPFITVNPATLPPAVVGVPYSQTISAVGGTASYTFTVSSGTLPPGLTLNAMTGVISGTPTTAGPFSFTITATDANGCPGSQAYSIVIPVVGVCVTCDEGVVVVDQNVTVDLNPAVPTCTGDPDLCLYFSFDKSGSSPSTWKAIFNVGPKKLLVTNGATITVVPGPPNGGNNKESPGIEIRSTCEVQIDEGAAVRVQSINRQAGDILIQADGNVTINGTVSNSVTGTNGRPGDITIASCCGNIVTGPKSLIQTFGSDYGGSDINLLACDGGNIAISGLVDASYKAASASTINIAAFSGAVTIDGRNFQGTEAGTQRPITSGVTVRSRRDPLAGKIFIQALNNVTVLGNKILDKIHPNYGAVAVKPTSTNGSSGDGRIFAESLEGKIVASDRAFDIANRFNGLNDITLVARDNIELSVTAAIDTAVVNSQGGSAGKGGENGLRSFTGQILIGTNAQVLANFTGTPGSNGTNTFTSCLGVDNNGTVLPAAVLATECSLVGLRPLFRGCAEFNAGCGNR